MALISQGVPQLGVVKQWWDGKNKFSYTRLSCTYLALARLSCSFLADCTYGRAYAIMLCPSDSVCLSIVCDSCSLICSSRIGLHAHQQTHRWVRSFVFDGAVCCLSSVVLVYVLWLSVLEQKLLLTA